MPTKAIHRIVLWLWVTAMPGLVQAEGLPPLTHHLTAIKGGLAAPALRLTNLDEQTIDLSALKGKVVVVNFWATWCPPCRREMGSLERLYQAGKGRGLEILAVNVGEDFDTVFSFMGTVEPAPNFQILFDPQAASLESWQVRGLPTTFIVRPDGTLAYSAVGGREFDHPEIQSKVLELIP